MSDSNDGVYNLKPVDSMENAVPEKVYLKRI